MTPTKSPILNGSRELLTRTYRLSQRLIRTYWLSSRRRSISHWRAFTVILFALGQLLLGSPSSRAALPKPQEIRILAAWEQRYQRLYGPQSACRSGLQRPQALAHWFYSPTSDESQLGPVTFFDVMANARDQTATVVQLSAAMRHISNEFGFRTEQRELEQWLNALPDSLMEQDHLNTVISVSLKTLLMSVGYQTLQFRLSNGKLAQFDLSATQKLLELFTSQVKAVFNSGIDIYPDPTPLEIAEVQQALAHYPLLFPTPADSNEIDNIARWLHLVNAFSAHAKSQISDSTELLLSPVVRFYLAYQLRKNPIYRSESPEVIARKAQQKQKFLSAVTRGAQFIERKGLFRAVVAHIGELKTSMTTLAGHENHFRKNLPMAEVSPSSTYQLNSEPIEASSFEDHFVATVMIPLANAVKIDFLSLIQFDSDAHKSLNSSGPQVYDNMVKNIAARRFNDARARRGYSALLKRFSHEFTILDKTHEGNYLQIDAEAEHRIVNEVEDLLDQMLTPLPPPPQALAQPLTPASILVSSRTSSAAEQRLPRKWLNGKSANTDSSLAQPTTEAMPLKQRTFRIEFEKTYWKALKPYPGVHEAFLMSDTYKALVEKPFFVGYTVTPHLPEKYRIAKFKFNNINYRIVFEFNTDLDKVQVVYIGTRDNFYDEIRGKFL